MDKTTYQREMSDDALDHLLAQATLVNAPVGAVDRRWRLRWHLEFISARAAMATHSSLQRPQ
jgi:hypothetical protein